VLIPAVLLAFMLTSFHSVDSQTGKIHARRLFAINASDQLPGP
jgi:hypothetical protein